MCFPVLFIFLGNFDADVVVVELSSEWRNTFVARLLVGATGFDELILLRGGIIDVNVDHLYIRFTWPVAHMYNMGASS